MTDFSDIQCCRDIAEEHVARAVATRAAMRAFLTQIAKVSRPMEGAPKILLALARLATRACDWIDEDLLIVISGGDERCTLEVLSDFGGGLHERVFALVKLGVPLDEFVRAVRLVPKMILPLKMKEQDGKLVFTATEHTRRTSMPPPPILIAPEHLSAPRAPRVPNVRRASSKRMQAVWEDSHGAKPTATGAKASVGRVPAPDHAAPLRRPSSNKVAAQQAPKPVVAEDDDDVDSGWET